MKYIQTSWERFFKLVVPDGASCEQVADMRMSFFCGAASVFYNIVHGAMDGGVEDSEKAEADDLRRLSALQDEITEFDAWLKEREKIRIPE